jgi:outer membrane receptor protein involved in Fe transport
LVPLSVGYNGFVYLDATARNDWSSTLPSDNNSYFYPSIGTSVIFSEFIPENNVLSFGKIRASYAEVGNDTDPYNILTTLGYQGIYNGIAWLALDETRNNPYLKPELTSSTEFGLELSFLRNRLTLNGTYYQSSTINQIIPAQVTTTTGYARQIFNAGEIANEGWELFASGKAMSRGTVPGTLI